MHAQTPEQAGRRTAGQFTRTMLAGFLLAGTLFVAPAALGASDEAAAQAFRPRCTVAAQEWGRAGAAIATGQWDSVARHATTAERAGSGGC